MVALALPVIVPAELLMKTIAHSPLESVPVEQLLLVTMLTAPLESSNATVTDSPDAGCKPEPEPLSTFTVTVNVWTYPTSLVSVPAMLMVALT